MNRFTIVKMKFGSHLYGTNTPDSDLDYKGVFLPTKREVFIGRIPKTDSYSTGSDKSKNTSKDIDTDLHSIHHFIALACKGETEAIDMLHAPDSMLIETSATWEAIVSERERFYTRELKAFVGYARRQAAKYGIKGSRLNAAEEFLELTKGWEGWDGGRANLSTVWKALPINDHCHHIETNSSGVRQYQICGKILQSTMKVEYARRIIRFFRDNYGERAKLAADNKGIDWKAVSHAMRAAYQVLELLIHGTITFPRPEAELLLAVKQGKCDYLTQVAPWLESVMEEVEFASSVSTYPTKVDKIYWEDFIVRTLEEYYR